MNLLRKPPLGLRDRSDGKDPAHLARVASLPCVICAEYGTRQTTPTQAHHCIHGRFGTRKVPDRMTIPLCRQHHEMLHANKREWAVTYGEDHTWLAPTLDKLGV